ncbi:MAG TPA: AraC family transcriptional regulator [Dongiaceae bacterium]|nr:AraC family transcriptional regulator [Dongiaceae bacterium]
MAAHQIAGAQARLERSCDTEVSDWIRIAPSAPGIDRAEICFTRRGYAPHRHDTYAIGFTAAGVQAFRYRGVNERSVAGQIFVLHPDELHDGRPAIDSGFRYRSLYIEPRLIHEALDHARPLPFVRRAVSRDRRLAAAILPALDDLASPLDEMQRDQIITDLAEALSAVDGSAPGKRLRAPDRRAVTRARAYLDANRLRNVGSGELESVTGLTRFELARHFRVAFGTSPYRYLTLRRLDHAKAMICAGGNLADTALTCGFADQSHMTRHFKRAFGLSPAHWLMLHRAAPRFTVA